MTASRANEPKQMSEEDYLKQHLKEIEDAKKVANNNNQSNYNNVGNQQQNQQQNSSRVDDLQYFTFDVKDMPLGQFYPTGTKLLVRAAQVKEIQAYSMVDDNNFYDMIEKMNDMLSACVRVKYLHTDNIGSYLDIKDGDRIFLVFLIRELTFQQGNSLKTNANCECGKTTEIELKRGNFSFYDINPKISRFFDVSSKTFKFKLKNGKVYDIAPPTIGLQKSFTDYIIKETNEKRQNSLNMSFLKIIPFLLPNRTSITIEGIKEKLNEFENMDDVSFQFLNSAVNMMLFGIKSIVSKCSCGLEVHSENIFPDGPSAVFIVHDAFDKYIEE